MRRSVDRLLTTHVGSLARVPGGVADVVTRQLEVGLDIINDGEQSKTGFVSYLPQRLDGFAVDEPVLRVIPPEDPELPGSGVEMLLPPCVGPVAWKDFAAVERDIANLRAATEGLDHQVFMNAPSPGTIANLLPNRFYADRTEYLGVLANVIKREYDAIAAAGFVVQVDGPDLGVRRHFPQLSARQWRELAADGVEALNHAIRDIPREQVRVHVCFGTMEAPHTSDPPLAEIVDLLLRLRVGALLLVGANARHEHEWRVWQEVALPDEMVLIPGVVDSTTNIVEHPQVVADRLMRYASVVGRERVIAGVDCGFATHASMTQVDADVAWAKLRSLVEGAQLASQALWPATAGSSRGSRGEAHG